MEKSSSRPSGSTPPKSRSSNEKSEERPDEWAIKPRTLSAAPTPSCWRSLRLGTMDLYVARQFVWIFWVTFCCLGLFYILMDFMGSCEDFFVQSAQRKISVPWLLSLYYYPRLLEIFDMFLGFFVIMSGIFTLCLLESRLELTGLTSMGVSRVRASLSIFLLAFGIVVFGAYNREVLLPMNRSTLTSSPNNFLDRVNQMSEKKTDASSRIIFYGKELNTQKKTISSPSFTLPRGSLDKYGMDLQGTMAYWKPPLETSEGAGKREAGFLVEKATIDGKSLDRLKSLYIQNKPFLITPLDNHWLKPGECFVVSRMSFEEFSFGRNSQQYARTNELVNVVPYVRLLYRSDILVEIYARIARPFVDLFCIFVGMSFILAPHAQPIPSIVKAIMWLLFVLLVMQLGRSLACDDTIPAAAGGLGPAAVLAVCMAYFWDEVFC